MISVNVIYAMPDEQKVLTLQVPLGTTVKTTIEQSGILMRYPEIDLSKLAIGIFSQKASLDDEVKEGYRIEIYRPLTQDPKSRRRLKI